MERGDRCRQRVADPVLKYEHAFTVDEQPATFRVIDELEVVENDLAEVEVVVAAAADLDGAGRDRPGRAGRIVHLGQVEDVFDTGASELLADAVIVGDGLCEQVEIVGRGDSDGVVAVEAEVVVVVGDPADEQKLGFPIQTDQTHWREARLVVLGVVVGRIGREWVEDAAGGRVIEPERHRAG